MGINDTEFAALVNRITTWDQSALDGLVGKAAIRYAEDHEKDVRRLARHMWEVFPLGPRWWKLSRALGEPLRLKNRAIKARAAQIGQDRAAGPRWRSGRYSPLTPAQGMEIE